MATQKRGCAFCPCMIQDWNIEMMFPHLFACTAWQLMVVDVVNKRNIVTKTWGDDFDEENELGYLETMVVNRSLLHQLLIANGSGWLKARLGYRYTCTHMSVMSPLRDGIFFFWKSLYCLPQLNTSILNDTPFIILILPSRPPLYPPWHSWPPV